MPGWVAMRLVIYDWGLKVAGEIFPFYAESTPGKIYELSLVLTARGEKLLCAE